jgi:GTP cyclohydrolase I
MNKLTDVQNSSDTRGISIQKVGVKKVHLPLQILTKKGDHQQVLGNVSLSADLNENYRGTHMSRFMEILTRWSTKKMSSVEVREILNEVIKKLEAESAEISVTFKYFIEKSSPITKTVGYLDYNCFFFGKLQNERFSFILGVEVPVQLVCPCSKEISKEGAHNQRALIRVKLEYYPQNFIWIEDLVEIIEKTGSSQVYPVIKREDEKYITEASFDNPKFVEDTLRDLVNELRKDNGIRWFGVECDSYESIHNHNAFACQKEYTGGIETREEEIALIPIDHLHFPI